MRGVSKGQTRQHRHFQSRQNRQNRHRTSSSEILHVFPPWAGRSASDSPVLLTAQNALSRIQVSGIRELYVRVKLMTCGLQVLCTQMLHCLNRFIISILGSFCHGPGFQAIDAHGWLQGQSLPDQSKTWGLWVWAKMLSWSLQGSLIGGALLSPTCQGGCRPRNATACHQTHALHLSPSHVCAKFSYDNIERTNTMKYAF